MHHVIQARLRHLTVRHCLRKIHEKGAVGLLLIETGQRSGNGAVSSPPIRHHEPLETPVALQNIGQRVRVLASVHAIDEIVGTHDGLDV